MFDELPRAHADPGRLASLGRAVGAISLMLIDIDGVERINTPHTELHEEREEAPDDVYDGSEEVVSDELPREHEQEQRDFPEGARRTEEVVSATAGAVRVVGDAHMPKSIRFYVSRARNPGRTTRCAPSRSL